MRSLTRSLAPQSPLPLLLGNFDMRYILTKHSLIYLRGRRSRDWLVCGSYKKNELTIVLYWPVTRSKRVNLNLNPVNPFAIATEQIVFGIPCDNRRIALWFNWSRTLFPTVLNCPSSSSTFIISIPLKQHVNENNPPVRSFCSPF